MNARIFAVLFVAIFLSGALPMLLVQPSGSAGAWLAEGFVLPVESPYHGAALIGIGLLAAWLGGEATVFIPLSALLMLVISAMLQIDTRAFPAVHNFLAGAIVLFALSISMLRNRMFLLYAVPVVGWAYLAGQRYMIAEAAAAVPLYFLLGALISAASMISIGVCLGITLSDYIRGSMEKMKALPGIASFLSFF